MILPGARYFILDKSLIHQHYQIRRCVNACHYFPTRIYVQQVPYDHIISLRQLCGKELTSTPNWYARKCLNPIHSIEHSTVVGDLSAAFIFWVHCYNAFRLSLNLSPLQNSNGKSMETYLSPLHFLSSTAWLIPFIFLIWPRDISGDWGRKRKHFHFVYIKEMCSSRYIKVKHLVFAEHLHGWKKSTLHQMLNIMLHKEVCL